MEKRIAIIAKTKGNFLSSIEYLFNQDKVEFIVTDNIENLENNITNIISIGNQNQIITDLLSNTLIPIVSITINNQFLKKEKGVINYVITPLVEDVTDYKEVQKEYLFRKGIYSIITKKIAELINDETNLNGFIMDFSECKTKLKDWVFNFDSISETYEWLLNKNKNTAKNFVRKTINFYHHKVYNDSLKEINYLAEIITGIKEGKKILDVFICTKEELKILKNNFFFKILLKNISTNYQIFIIERNLLLNDEPKIYNKLLDGVSIYEDSVYIDTYSDEYSLGFVDCKQKTINEYNEYFDYVLNKYGKKISMESDIDGI